MKKCKKCNVEKVLSDFYQHQQKGKNGQTWPYLDCYCKECRKYYAAKRSKNIKIQCVEYMGGRCEKCGLIDDPCVYDFHHLDPSIKELAFGNRGGKTFDSLKPELDKCILLCANCHRKEHSKFY